MFIVIYERLKHLTYMYMYSPDHIKGVMFSCVMCRLHQSIIDELIIHWCQLRENMAQGQDFTL